MASQLLKYFTGLSRAPPNQRRILCHHRVPGDDVFEPEADGGDFIRFPALARVCVFARRVVLWLQLSARPSEGGGARALCCARAAARAHQADELRSSGCSQPRFSLLTRGGELEPPFVLFLGLIASKECSCRGCCFKTHAEILFLLLQLVTVFVLLTFVSYPAGGL